MFGKRVKLFSFKGIPVEISTLALMLIGLGLLPLALNLLPAVLLGRQAGRGLLSALPLALLPLGLFGSILLHEVAHALVGMRFGSKVTAIHLNLLGGATFFASRAPAYFKDLLIFLAGPVSNLILWKLFELLANLTQTSNPGLTGTFAYLAQLNLFLAVFNALPAFPLDGGQAAYVLLMGLTSQQKFAARTILLLSLGVAAYLVFGQVEVLGQDLIGSLFTWLIALWIVTSCLALYNQATTIVNFYPSSEEQFAQWQKTAQKWAKERHSPQLFEQGQAELAAGQPELALGSFVQALEQSPDQPDYLAYRAETYRQLGEYRRALADYNQALELLLRPKSKPGKVTAGATISTNLLAQHLKLYLGRAEVEQHLGMFYQAKADLEQVLKADPLNLQALLLEQELAGHSFFGSNGLAPQVYPYPPSFSPYPVGINPNRPG